MKSPRVVFGHTLAWFGEAWSQAPFALRRRWPWLLAAGALAGFLLVLWLRPSREQPESPEPVEVRATEAPAEAEESAAPPGEPAQEATAQPVRPPRVDAGPPLSPNVKLTFRTFPPRRASVHWGAKRLGFTDRGRPLVIERPRDSGPLDVVVRAQGYLPVHARAYTFDDANIDVRITPVEKKDTIYGYQQPLGDAGAPVLQPSL